MELQRQQVFSSIYKSELKFCQTMQLGIQTYYRPLSDSVLSSEQHSTLFQNVLQVNMPLLSIFVPTDQRKTIIQQENLQKYRLNQAKVSDKCAFLASVVEDYPLVL